MKRSNSIFRLLTFGYWAKALLLVLLAGLPGSALWAQEEEEEPEQLSSRMSLSAIQGDEDKLTLKALVRAKIDGRFTGLQGLEVVFFSLSDTLEKELGRDSTDMDGIASLSVSKSALQADTGGAFILKAVFEGNALFEESDDEIAVTAAGMALEAMEEDSVRTLIATLESGGAPIAEADVYFYVQGTFSPLKIGEATTDEEGIASVEFPAGLPGGPDGNIHIIARLEEDETFGTVEANVNKAWGRQLETSHNQSRALWSSSPPLWLLLTFITLLVIIWGHYLEVVYKLFRLRKKAAAEG